VFIGVFNLVPLLPLDGGHVAIATYEKIRSMLRGGAAYHVDVTKLLPITYAVVLVLVFLGISTVYLDIADPIGG
jgi:membrane-associated protease RseP (regulator of RpoE activity)